MELDRADKIAADLCSAYQDEGVAAFVIRTTAEGDVRWIGPQLPAQLVTQMMRSAADGYEVSFPAWKLNS